MSYFKTQYNGDNFEHHRERFTMPSLTQPDQVMSIDDMLARHQGGLPVQGPRNPHMYYDLPEEMGYVPDVKSLDLSEIQDLRNELSNRVRYLKAEQSRKELEEKEALKAREVPPEPEESAPGQGETSQQDE